MGKYFNQKIECASRAEITRIQDERLVNTVRRVYENVPAYRRKMDEAGIKPEDIPPLFYNAVQSIKKTAAAVRLITAAAASLLNMQFLI